jgi:hypothetical protein
VATLAEGLGGALLLDLKLHDRVAMLDAHVVVPDPAPVGDPLLDGALAAIAGEGRDRDPDHWSPLGCCGSRTPGSSG